MMKKLQDIFISTRTMAVLLLVFAIAMAYATFLENDFGTPAAKALIYEAKWFELIMLLLIINFCGNIWRYRLWRREKWPVLIFHLSFILLFIGGAITRYISFEGIMHIREGESSNEIITDKNFFKIQIEEKGDVLSYQDVPYLMSPLHKDFHATYDYHGQQFRVDALDYVQRKKDTVMAGQGQTEYLHFVSAGERGRVNYYLKSGETESIGGTLVSYNRPIAGAIEFRNDNGKLSIKTPSDATYMVMATQQTGSVKKDEYAPLSLRSLYTIGETRIVVPQGLVRGKLVSVEGDKKKESNLPDALTVKVQGPKSSTVVELPVEKGNPNIYKQITLDGKNIMLGFGPKIYNTPFMLKLDDFVMETYPGSSAPSAYESHVKIIENGTETPYKIYMNHVLDHGGYRFFQSNFDPDRQGTILSVNHDYWGTLISYIGYFFLFTSMFVVFFWKGTHFWKLSKMLKEINAKRNISILLLLLTVGGLSAQEIDMHGKNADQVRTVSPSQQGAAQPIQNLRTISPKDIIAKSKISKEHADKFAYLLVQNFEGRIVPISTQALDVLRKLYKHDSFTAEDGSKLTAEQWFLAITTDTPSWTMVPMIKVGTKGGEELARKAKANEDGYTSLMNLFPPDGQGGLRYVLEEDYNTAFRKRAADQSNYDHEVIALNERVQIFNEFFTGQFLKVVPVKNDPNNTWHSWLDQNMEPDMESQNVMGPYFAEVLEARRTGNWARADAELEKLMAYQKTWGKNVIPEQSKVDVEVFMNRLNINFWLMIFYTFIGGLLMLLGFVNLFRPRKIITRIIYALLLVGMVGWVLQFIGLIGRWYVSGHAPWSNGYEAIVFISWVGITAGLFFYFGFGKGKHEQPKRGLAKFLDTEKASNALIPAAGFMVAVLMMGFAHGGSALDPQITPLVPVLKSYWLIIHVAIIVSSYGFFGLSFIIAIFTLIFYIIANQKWFDIHHDSTIKELAIVSEMSMSVGLYALTVGTFLGGIWANESWGRYWSWDPKETWAFISVMVYAFILHMRLVPGLRSRWAFSVAALFGILSVFMTYFGVNYYLAGLHSYAQGDPVPVPLWVYLSLAAMVLLSVFSYFKFKKLNARRER